jgi:membrane-associated phospholipid phosphatase
VTVPAGESTVDLQPGDAGAGVLAALHRWDAELFRRTAQRHDPVLDLVLPALSRAADHSRLWLAAAALLALSGRRRAAASGLAAVTLASTTTNIAVKLAVGRERPPVAAVPAGRRLRRQPVTTSFPSGHSASAAAFAVAAAREAPGAAMPLWGLAAAVAWSRVWTGVHYPGDVAAGAAIGIAAAAALRRPRDGSAS